MEKMSKDSFQIIINLLLTGTRRPKIEKQKAPISPINGEIVGTATAISTASVTSTVLCEIENIVFNELKEKIS